MKEKRPRIRKAKKEPTRGRKPRNPSRNPLQITGLWGRGASEYRPGIFTKRYFEEHGGEACCADAFYSLSQHIEELNRERVAIGEAAFRRPNYSSFSRYFHWFLILGLIERTGKVEASIYPFLEKRVFYRLTDRGRTEVRGWGDPVSVRHPELR